MPYLEAFDSRQLRNVLGTFTTGVTVVTTRDAGGVDHGVTANSFSSVSLDPPLILWSQAYTSRSFGAFRQSEYFAVNILADDQVELSNHFARAKDDKFTGLAYTRGLGGVAVLAGTVAHFECVKEAAYPAGDHMIFIGRVHHVGHSGRRPLAFAHGRYMVPYAHELGPVELRRADAPGPNADALRLATEALPELRAAVGGHTVSLAAWGNHGPVVIDWCGTPSTQQARAGLVVSVTGSAAGRAFVAWLPAEITRAFVEESLRLHRVADEDENLQRAAFEQEISSAREHGLTRAVGEETAFSAPVFDAAGKVILALSVAASAKALPAAWDGEVPRTLLRHAQRLGEQIAATGSK